MARGFVLVRHYCSECGSRVFPFDKYDQTTEYPQEHPRPLLLKTHNAEHKEERIAWCFNEKRFVEVERRTEYEIISLYLKRKGVIYRGGPPTWARRE